MEPREEPHKRQKSWPAYRSTLDHSHFEGSGIRQSPLRLLVAPSANAPLPFERLPRELRDQVYMYVFETQESTSASTGGKLKGTGAREGTVKKPINRKTERENRLVLDLSKPFWLYRFPADLVEDVEPFVYARCTVVIHCGSKLSDGHVEILKKAQSLAINYDATPASFKDDVMPILCKRDNLRYLRVSFTSWPLRLKVQGRDAAMLVEKKLTFLAEVKANHVVLELKSFFQPWKIKVLQRLANIMMGDEGARAVNVISSIPIVRREAPRARTSTPTMSSGPNRLENASQTNAVRAQSVPSASVSTPSKSSES